jgi:hypothetical protein
VQRCVDIIEFSFKCHNTDTCTPVRLCPHLDCNLLNTAVKFEGEENMLPAVEEGTVVVWVRMVMWY